MTWLTSASAGDSLADTRNDPLSRVALRRHGDRDAAGGHARLFDNAAGTGRSCGGHAGRSGDRGRHRETAFFLWTRQAAAAAVRLLAGRAGPRESGPVDLSTATGHAGAARARRADLFPYPLFDPHRDADRGSLRDRCRRVAWQDN